MIKWRHHFHENPELAYKEFNTSKKVISLLKEFGITENRRRYRKNWSCSYFRKWKGKTIGLRADMDALPIFEENKNKKYKSK